MRPVASLLVVAGGAAVVAALLARAPAVQARPCGAGAVHAVIAGKHRCVRAGHGCVSRLDTQYHRYRFHCHGGVLEAFVWAPLRRPLRLPVVEPGSPCPVSEARQVHGRWGAALGDGPVFGVLGLAPGPAFRPLQGAPGPGGYYVKMIWIGDPARFTGNFLLRGRRLDGAGAVRFSDTETASPPAEARMALRRASEPGDWREAYGPRYLRVPGAGCYGLQADGTTISNVAVFEAG